MRASGRGGRQGPRGDPVPPRALVAFMGDVSGRESRCAWCMRVAGPVLYALWLVMVRKSRRRGGFARSLQQDFANPSRLMGLSKSLLINI